MTTALRSLSKANDRHIHGRLTNNVQCLFLAYARGRVALGPRRQRGRIVSTLSF